ncbi:hypothetical protein BH10ACI2_BH10ACI2_04720 [soil metagenome]
MIVEILKSLFERDLDKLRDEIARYSDETKIWEVGHDISNSAGNLCLHLIGNLSTYIGAELGNSGYVRHRDLEFSTKGTSQAELIQRIEETKAIVVGTLSKLTDEQMAEDYPQIVFTDKMTTGWFLMHCATHFNYHLGQINYHRRFFDAGAE